MKALLLLALFPFQMAAAQDSTVTIKGKVDISIKKGTFDCDLTVSNIPRIDDYVFRINTGMNIRSILEPASNNRMLYFDYDVHDTTSSGETLGYYLHLRPFGLTRYLPKEFKIRYCGMYPVVTDSASGWTSADWRGNLAFNGYSLRADGYQSGWYPVLYDLTKQREYEKVNYDLTLTCADCSILFVNGCSPVRSSVGHFVSDAPREIALYVGDFEASEVNNSWLLNADLSKDQQTALLNFINSVKDYYGEKMSIPYKANITYVNTTPTADPIMWAFSFVSSPTIINVGAGQYGLKGAFDKESADSRKETITHELGHYYFGTLLRTNTAFGPVINEGFTEFLSLKATKTRISDSAYKKLVDSKLKALGGLMISPFASVKKEDDFHNRELYLYYLTPIILTAIEKEIGEDATWKWLHTMVTTKTEFTDYAFFERTFDASIADKKKVAEVKAKYFTTDQALKNAIQELGLSPTISSQ